MKKIVLFFFTFALIFALSSCNKEKTACQNCDKDAALCSDCAREIVDFKKCPFCSYQNLASSVYCGMCGLDMTDNKADEEIEVVKVTVMGPEGNIICQETVELGAKNQNSIQGVNFYGLDCFEAALTQAGIGYTIDKSDYDSYSITSVGNVVCDEENAFSYYVNGVNKNALSAQHDEVEAGESLEFRYEKITLPQ